MLTQDGEASGLDPEGLHTTVVPENTKPLIGTLDWRLLALPLLIATEKLLIVIFLHSQSLNQALRVRLDVVYSASSVSVLHGVLLIANDPREAFFINLLVHPDLQPAFRFRLSA